MISYPKMISITILTKNNGCFIGTVLSSLQKFPEVVIYDTGSSDATLEICKKFQNVKIFEGEREGFGAMHNKASTLASHDWILSIDSDEIVSKEMNEEIFSLDLDPNKVYSFPRKNYYNGKWIKGCGWHPDRKVRLYNRLKTTFSNDYVHEKILENGLCNEKLQGAILHYSYNKISDFLDKMQLYSELFAAQYSGRKNSSLSKAVLHLGSAFFKSYFVKWGFLLGREGFEISMYNGITAYYKYLKLLEANQRVSFVEDTQEFFYVQKKKEGYEVQK